MSGSPHFRIGTRGSDLALWQARHVLDLVRSIGGTAEIVILSTKGDREQVQSFEKLEGKGFFTKEIEEALLENRIDIAVHSHKDLETRQPEGLTIAAVPERASARDVLLVRKDRVVTSPWLPLEDQAVVGTSSVRRRDQLLLLRPDLDIRALRGNVPTRVNRLAEGQYDAIVLAEAGLQRLGLDLDGLHVHPLDPAHFVPAPAQGALALQMRTDDDRVPLIQQLQDPDVARNVAMERNVLQALEGGCQLPFGAHWDGKSHGLRCFLQDASGARRIVAPDAATALDRLSRRQARTVHITRSPRPADLLHRLAEGAGITLIERPLIGIRNLDSPPVPDAWGDRGPDWIWLGSPGAALAAAAWSLQWPTARIAVPGPGTAESLSEEWQVRLAFIGPGHPASAWTAFSSVCKGQHVAIPHGTASTRRWRDLPLEAELHAWEHYENIPSNEAQIDADIVCFTSPSNVEAWIGDPPAGSIAIGPTTSAAMTRKGWPHVTASSPDAFGIWEALEHV